MMSIMCAVIAILAVTFSTSGMAQASALHCVMRGRDIQPHQFVDIFEIDAAQDRIVRVDGQDIATSDWSQQVSAAEFHLTKPGPGRQHNGGDGLPYWEWRINRFTGKARHSVWVAVHGTRSHWAGRCTSYMK